MRRETFGMYPGTLADRALVGQVLRRAFPLGLRSFEGLPSTSFYERKHEPYTAFEPPDGGQGMIWTAD